jgi:antitoxin PrlF
MEMLAVRTGLTLAWAASIQFGMNINTKDMRSRVADRGQVTIAKALRDRLGVVPGTTLEFSEEHGRLVAVKADPVAKVHGCLGRKFDTDAFMAPIRGVRSSELL